MFYPELRKVLWVDSLGHAPFPHRVVREQTLDVCPGHNDGVEPVRPPRPKSTLPVPKKVWRVRTLHGRSVGMSW